MRAIVYIFFCCFPLAGIAQNDTTNQLDSNGKKTGYWEEYHSDSTLVRSGHYLNGRRTGQWTAYYRNGAVRSKSVYKHGRRRGPLETFFPSGCPESKGVWHYRHYKGELLQYFEHPCNQLHYKAFYNESGECLWRINFAANGEIIDTVQEPVTRGKFEKIYPPGPYQKFEFNTAKDTSQNAQIAPDISSIRPISTGEKFSINQNGLKEGYWEEQVGQYVVCGQYKAGKRTGVWKAKQRHRQGTNPIDSVTFIHDYDMTSFFDEALWVYDGKIPIWTTGDENGNDRKVEKYYIPTGQVWMHGQLINRQLFHGKYYVYDGDFKLVRIFIIKHGKYVGDGVMEEEED